MAKPRKRVRRRDIKLFAETPSPKIGLPPGTPVHVGAPQSFTPYVSLIQYHGAEFREIERLDPNQLPDILRSDRINWVNVEGIHDVKLVQNVCDRLNIHPLTQEDIVNTRLRPQFDAFPNYFFFCLQMLYLPADHHLRNEHVAIILHGNTVVTFQETPGDVFGRIRERLRAQTGLVRSRTAEYLVYMLLDSIVDGYYQVVDDLGERIEALEDELRRGIKDSHLEKIYCLKREVLFLRKNISPVRDLLSKANVEERVFHDSRIYLTDLSSHIVQVTESLAVCTEMSAVLIDTYHSMLNQRMNAIMKTLTMMSTVFLPLNFIAGIYGMNFEHIPELKWEYGYPMALSLMLVIAAGMMIWFVRRGWLLAQEPDERLNGNGSETTVSN